MATAAKATPQDLPPSGGYGAFTTERTKLRTLFRGRTAIAVYFAVNAGGFYLYFQNFKYMKKHDVEMRSARLAMFPVLLAERDRAFLKQLTRNRNDETELMKDVPNWEVGKFYEKSIFKTIPDDVLTEPMYSEYCVHTSRKEYLRRAHLSLWT